MSELTTTIAAAAAAGKILESSAKNIQALLSKSTSPLNEAVIRELVETENWKELDNRFFRTLAFGTGGLRGKTIGATLTKVEAGTLQPLDRPEFPCVGTNAMNYYNISRATQGLVAYVKEHFARSGREGKPSICISHDTRYFSREFAELAAKVMVENGVDAYLFEGPRSTPELSFAVRYTNSQAGINITASHNPPQYNGYKVYFEDGCQVTEPHASAIIDKVNAVESDNYAPVTAAEQGKVIPMGEEVDEAYMARLEKLPLNPELIRKENSLKVVYTPLHGVGGVIIKPMLQRLGFQFLTVESQEVPDGRFPTVKSPNPENAEALSLAVKLAEETGSDLVIATDPDDDRMGIAVRNDEGKMVLLTGNQIGSLMAWYRASQHFALVILTKENASRGVIIKTFVTTDLQKAIAEKFGLRTVETLTGFKYIGEKLGKYEEQIPAELRQNYRQLSEETTRDLRIKHSSLYVFGGEESYGYSGSDFVRDKDGNSAAVMIAEVAAYAKSQGLTLVGLLDNIYREYGYYLERGESLTMEGAEGAAQIKKLVDSYAANPPTTLDGAAVVSVQNFATEEIYDSEGVRIPAEAMLMITLADNRRIAVRPSGTEPKIKYYMFAAQKPAEGQSFTAEELAAIKTRVAASIQSLWETLKADADARLK
ncbi:MAG: phosphomannomutase [Verrucomicrobia bacterium 61-8]|nr:phospho-sugar mutase [Verrucomicrobiota bacterium]OJU99149.1 MAG: phosphomannomutase [Verrucomicrobia bacterium 61-8]